MVGGGKGKGSGRGMTYGGGVGVMMTSGSNPFTQPGHRSYPVPLGPKQHRQWNTRPDRAAPHPSHVYTPWPYVPGCTLPANAATLSHSISLCPPRPTLIHPPTPQLATAGLRQRQDDALGPMHRGHRSNVPHCTAPGRERQCRGWRGCTKLAAGTHGNATRFRCTIGGTCRSCTGRPSMTWTSPSQTRAWTGRSATRWASGRRGRGNAGTHTYLQRERAPVAPLSLAHEGR